MARAGSEQTKAAREARQAKAEAEAHRVAELRNQRARQLESTKSAIGNLDAALHSVRKNINHCEALSSHLRGFYEEIDKLAKGKQLLSVTDLVVEQANDIVRDAKTLIQGDPYLERVKELVPAGDNPVYPDVLLTARAVQQSLERFETNVTTQKERLVNMLEEARTIQAALQYCLSNEGEIASKENVEKLLDGRVIDAWFKGDYGSGYHFDFSRLDRCNLDEYLSEVRALG
jgi:hypothetical protein